MARDPTWLRTSWSSLWGLCETITSETPNFLPSRAILAAESLVLQSPSPPGMNAWASSSARTMGPGEAPPPPCPALDLFLSMSTSSMNCEITTSACLGERSERFTTFT
ncbi:MAG: hypothetical protein RXP77_03295 [Nitrososphaeria archaeon]